MVDWAGKSHRKGKASIDKLVTLDFRFKWLAEEKITGLIACRLL
jgi:hypothetical protein